MELHRSAEATRLSSPTREFSPEDAAGGGGGGGAGSTGGTVGGGGTVLPSALARSLRLRLVEYLESQLATHISMFYGC